MKKKLILITVFAVMALAMLGVLTTQAQAQTTVTKLIRKGQTISTIARASNVVTVVLSAAYPNSNLVAGQSIVIETGTDGTASFEGTFVIASVASQTQFTYAQTAANETGTVGAGATAGGDYTTLTAWNAGQAANITAAGNNTIQVAECYNDWATTGADDTLFDNVTLTGWTTDATHYVKIYTPTSERHKRLAGTGFRLKCGATNDIAIAISAGSGYTKIEGLEILAPTTLNWSQNAVYVYGDAGGIPTISENLIYGFKYSTSGGPAISTNYTSTVYNNIVYDCGSGIYSSAYNPGGFKFYNNIVYNCLAYGIEARRQTYIYNNTVYKCATGIMTNTTGAYTLRNNLSIGNTTADYDFTTATSVTASNNISSDATADDYGGEGNIISKTLSDVKFVSRTTGYEDYRVQPDSCAVGVGMNLSSDANCPITTDIDNHTRTGWDVGADEAAKEFICNIRVAGATSPAPDYNLLSTWESGCDETDYTLNTTRVFSGAKTGTVADAASVTLYRGGASQSVTGTVVHAGASQILVKSISNGAFAFTSGDQWRVGGVDTNMFQITDGGDTAVLVAECYNDWPSGLDDSVQLGGMVAYNTIHADAQHKVIIRTPLSQRHNGTAHTGFYLKPTTATEFFSLIQGWYASDYEFDGLEIDGSGRAAASTAFLIRESSKNITIKNCLIHDMGSPSTFAQAILSYAATPYVQNLQIYNNIFYNISGCALIIPASNIVYFYNNTIYNTNSRDESSYGGVYLGSTSLVKNNVAIGNYRYDFRGTPFASGSDYNISSDDTAPGAHSLKSSNLTPDASGATEFTSVTAGSEDLRLKAGAN
ncbi:MAG: right-handed parallel beta-helix repeat-containing protein, partial [Candidatus Omnitrophica bacterium]|nr:right-handed parallel beta-helix repeat-containing protein [Candidatus Omnitrophota bacterium]